MSASQQKVLVSGANGFVGCYVVHNLLERGYFVRGTVRSAEKGKYLSRLFEPYGHRFELVVVPDITKEGAFNEAVKGMTAILHTASPFNFKSDDPKAYIEPAVKGTLGMLQSAAQNAPSVKRIVVTSSVASVVHWTSNRPTPWTEDDWNTKSITVVEEQGVQAPDVDKYCASKSLAEKAAWDFKKTNDVSWDLVTLCPPYIFGPVIHECGRTEDLNESVDVLYKAVIKGLPDEPALMRPGANWVDVLDLAEAHSLALEKAAAGGHRFIITAGPHVLQEFVNIAHTLNIIPTDTLPREIPERELPTPIVTYDTSKSKNILGLTYKSKDEMMTRFLGDLKRRGWF
ncbi:Ketoreductase azaE [Mycena venus]|uniref:Ketoreductase azaE n=1 Tax=Mycena venus TaxID=2733690 RepID=A0A8H6XLE1_9AGAR|nr:Ketoreductase azaE [Mycena venus]